MMLLTINLSLKFKSLPVIIILMIYLLMVPSAIKSDTLIMNNGTLLVGKVKRESSLTIVFKNTYGAFTVRRSDITALYITGSYEEDISIRKKLGMDFDVEEIKKNYAAGQKDLTEKEKTLIAKEKTSELSNVSKNTGLDLTGKFFIESAGIASLGRLRDSIPYGYGGFTGLEAGEKYIDNPGRNSFIPMLRAEAGYLRFEKSDALLSGYTAGVGPLWVFPVSDDSRGNIRFSAEPGISSFSIKKGEVSDSTITFTFHSILGYEYSFDYVSIFLNLRYLYVYDKDVLFNSAGVSAGVSGKLW